jgi:hypothetical protein
MTTSGGPASVTDEAGGPVFRRFNAVAAAAAAAAAAIDNGTGDDDAVGSGPSHAAHFRACTSFSNVHCGHDITAIGIVAVVAEVAGGEALDNKPVGVGDEAMAATVALAVVAWGPAAACTA